MLRCPELLAACRGGGIAGGRGGRAAGCRRRQVHFGARLVAKPEGVWPQGLRELGKRDAVVSGRAVGVKHDLG